MKQAFKSTRRRRQSGIALVTSMMIAVATAMVLSAGLSVVMAQNQLEWSEANAEAALQLADAGINSELQYIASNVNQTTLTLKSSQPLVSVGVTLVYPGTGSTVLGRQGSVAGYTNGHFYVYTSNNAAGTVAWDGVTTPYYITSAGYVQGNWQRVQVTATSTSLFNLYGTYALASYPGNPTGVTLASNANVTVSGAAGINGQVSTGKGASITGSQIINANTCTYSSGQYTSSNVASGGSMSSCSNPFIYPTTATVLKTSLCKQPTYTDAQAWTWLGNNCSNTSCVYQYRANASSNTINTTNCCQYGFTGTTLNNSCFTNANTEPGTYNFPAYWWFPQTYAVNTLIFEPGDYYFTSMQLAYSASCQMVIDSQAYASGGTPGQVRFWLYDANATTDGNNADSISLPVTNTCAAGTSTPDCGMWRVYCGKDNCSCTFNRPSNVTDWQGNTVSGDFTYCCGVYATTKQCNGVSASQGSCSTTTDNTSLHGCTVSFTGTSSKSGGCSTCCGSCLCDKMSCSGYCKITYQASACCTKDPCGGGQITSWCKA